MLKILLETTIEIVLALHVAYRKVPEKNSTFVFIPLTVRVEFARSFYEVSMPKGLRANLLSVHFVLHVHASLLKK